MFDNYEHMVYFGIVELIDQWGGGCLYNFYFISTKSPIHPQK